MSAPDWYNLIAADRGKPEGWRWYSLQAVNDSTIVEGGIPRSLVTRGPRKGLPNWTKPDAVSKMIVSPADVLARKLRFEAETGNCHQCGGVGQEFKGWSKEAGRLTRECRRCRGNGKAPP